jgi:hypothetical protein
MPVVQPSTDSGFSPLSELGKSSEWPIPIYNWFYQLHKLSPRWASLVNSWLHLEELDKFAGAQRLGGKKGGDFRPKAVKDWILAARALDFMPQNFPTLEEYERTYWQWWRGLQHDFRKADQQEDGEVIYLKQVPPADSIKHPWRRVNVTGCNGLTSALAGLCLWGLHIRPLPSEDTKQEENRDDIVRRWLRAVGDVRFVIDQIISNRSQP